MKYHYHVAFSHIRGFGSCTSILDEPITTNEAVNSLRDSYMRDYKVKGVVILNWILLRTEEEQ